MTEIKTIQCADVNCFLVTQDGKSILIDTGRSMFKKKVLANCKDANVQLIVLTHGHSDHIQNATYLSEKLNAPIAIHKNDEDLISDNAAQILSVNGLHKSISTSLTKLSSYLYKFEEFTPDVYLKEGDTLDEYGINAKIIEVPGHTKGSIAIDLNEKYMFVGDALMNVIRPTPSRLYFNYDGMVESAKKISTFENRVILFGHGKPVNNMQWVK